MNENTNLNGDINKDLSIESERSEIVYSGKIGFGIASMICGIVALVLCCIGWISIPVAIVGLVLGAVAISKKYAGHGMAIAGIVCSIIALVLYLLAMIWGAGTWAAILSELS